MTPRATPKPVLRKDRYMSEELKPCPFCGSKNVVVYELKGQKTLWIECKGCWASSNALDSSKKAQAIKLWNTRTDTALREALEPLQEFARKVIKGVCWGYPELDGCEIQDLAEELGLVRLVTATEEHWNEESDFSIGDEIYEFTDKIKE
jgi:Lar family restriction alleviation protein